jgi:hypothetical protein
VTASTRSRVPAKTSRPRTKPSVAAREAEADDGYVYLEQCGVKLRVPVGGKVTIAAIDAFRMGDNYEGTKRLLGEEQWQRLSDAGVTADDLDELGNKLKEARGN